jgi:ankyrin repeat protein
MLQHAIFKESPDCVEFLLKHGANPNLHFGGSPAPLELARRTHNQAIIKLLRRYGATVYNSVD